jgi:hypothetical protein
LAVSHPYSPPRPWDSKQCSFFQSRKQEFIDELLQFVRQSRFSANLILSGVDMSNRTDAQMMFVAVQILFREFVRVRVGAHETSPARRRTTFTREILHRGSIHRYPPSSSFLFQSIRHLMFSIPVPHTTKDRSLSSPAVASRDGSSPTFRSLGKFQQLHSSTSWLKATIDPTHRSWQRLWPRYFH